jgi:hypothetical protein
MIEYVKKILEWISGSLNSNDLVQMGKVVLVLCAISLCLTTLFLWVIYQAILAWGFLAGAILFWLALFAGNAFAKFWMPTCLKWVRNKLWPPDPPSQEAVAQPLDQKFTDL